ELMREVSPTADRRRQSRRGNSKRSLESLIVEAAGSSLVGTLVGLATELLRPKLAQILPPAFRQLAVEQRSSIVEAIALGEPDAARGAMELHLNTLARALDTVDGQGGRRPSPSGALAS